MNQTERIEQMERCLDRAETAVKAAEAALEQLEAVKDDVRRLADYYGSALWRKDFEDDEAGLLPPGLKRGVLSEDAVWNVLTRFRELTGTRR